MCLSKTLDKRPYVVTKNNPLSLLKIINNLFMSLILKANSSTGGDFKSLDAGSYPARLVSISQIGTHTNQFGSTQPKVIFEYEIIGETITAGDKEYPRTLCSEYALSLNKKANLYSVIKTLIARNVEDGEEIDVYSTLGSPCMLNVVNNTKGDKTYAQIDAVTQPMKGYEVPAETLEKFIFDFDTNFGTLDTAQKRLPKYQYEKILVSPEYATKSGIKKPTDDAFEDF